MAVFDEVQIAKNEDSGTWHALKNIEYTYSLSLSGTIFANCWSDGFGPISFLKNHPFDTRAKYSRAFANRHSSSNIARPTISKENRYVKFLQGILLSRPTSLLDMPELNIERTIFWILDQEDISMIMYLVKQFYDSLRTAGLTTLAVTDTGKRDRQRAIFFATTAQQIAGNKHMIQSKG